MVLTSVKTERHVTSPEIIFPFLPFSTPRQFPPPRPPPRWVVTRSFVLRPTGYNLHVAQRVHNTAADFRGEARPEREPDEAQVRVQDSGHAAAQQDDYGPGPQRERTRLPGEVCAGSGHRHRRRSVLRAAGAACATAKP